MSNGDDVLDNWEEIDEAELTSKLQKLEKECKSKDESQLEDIKAYSAIISTEDIAITPTTTPSVPGTMKLLQRAAQSKILPSTTVATPQQTVASAVAEDVTSPLDDMNSTFQPVLMVLHKDTDEYQSANYTQPINTQTVKILRRPTQSSEPRNNGVRPKQPIKTLQQREQEYAEARLRILGSAKNPEDDTSANASPTATPSSNNITTTTNTSVVAAATAAATPATPTTATTPTQSVTTTNNTQAKTNASVPRNQSQQQQHYGTAQSVYNNYYQQQQQQQNLYYQKQQLQQQQQQHLQHSLSSPAFGNNRLQFSTTGLLPTPPIAPVVATNLQQRHQFQQLQHYHPQQQQQQQTWSPVVGGSVSSYTLQRQQQRQQQQQQQQQLQQQQQHQLDILRTPRGPDGSTGFQMRR